MDKEALEKAVEAWEAWFHLYGGKTTDAMESAIQAYLEAVGGVVVPKEPTDAMHNAARDWSNRKYGKPIGIDASDGCYRAMITAAQEEEQ